MKPELWDEIERFLKGELNPQEISAFQAKLKSDSAFREKFEQHKELLNTFQKYSERQALQQRLNAIPLKKERSKFRLNVKTYAVAASITSLFTLFGGYFYLKSNNNNAEYKALKKDVDHIRTWQQVISQKLNTPSYNASVTGLLLNRKGYILTTAHGLKGADKIEVENNSGSFSAKLIKLDELNDLALLKISDTLTDLPVPNYSLFTKAPEIVEKSFILGYPDKDMVYGEGVIVCTNGFNGDTSSFQLNIFANPGNSGSPVFNDKGELIGIIKGKPKDSPGASYAVKGEFIQEFIKSSKENLKLNRKNKLKSLNRKDKAKQLEKCIYRVKIY
ncbi:S1 family peptidase [Sporocytophaga myxococcoides]|uniref:S1 family peptidase n=1 Tax=Sporocytophaga myxococcoides TaxID=153721 RepID=UPI000422EF64|nr:S1C family serine protease [Sporocytophaga myxococcoides]